MKVEGSAPSLHVDASVADGKDVCDAFVTTVMCWEMLNTNYHLSEGDLHCKAASPAIILNVTVTDRLSKTKYTVGGLQICSACGKIGRLTGGSGSSAFRSTTPSTR